MKIRRFKILKDKIEVEFQELKPDGTQKKVKEEHETKPHPDLLQSYYNLRVHWGIGCGYLLPKQVKKIETPNEDLVESFSVHSLSVKSGDDPGVVLTGQKTLEDGTRVTVNTKFIRFDTESDHAYRFIDDLIEKVNRAEIEITAFLDGSKKGNDPQQSLGFPEGGSGTTTTDEENLEFEDVDDSAPDKVWKDGQRPTV